MSPMEALIIKTDNKFRSLITKRAYAKGEMICDIPTEKIVNKPNRFTIQIDRDKHTEVGKLAALNHSCDPNVILDMTNFIVYAARDIDKGEEL
ncbi:MAG TPA: SET domain-containing protein-lysine N-methyltransferase, partial [Anaerolineales bacterium]|nr:SET domain-containing protein-lysine N-methyltransferase [Anaerolineales bacterium]